MIDATDQRLGFEFRPSNLGRHLGDGETIMAANQVGHRGRELLALSCLPTDEEQGYSGQEQDTGEEQAWHQALQRRLAF
jgi:hypothetical protein